MSDPIMVPRSVLATLVRLADEFAECLKVTCEEAGSEGKYEDAKKAAMIAKLATETARAAREALA